MQRKSVIGLLTPFLGGNYLGDVINSIQLAASKYDVQLIIIRTAGKKFDSPMSLDLVDGWIILNNAATDAYIVELAQSWAKPIVTIAKDVSTLNIDGGMLSCDNEGGIIKAVRHLYEHGHREIGFIGEMNLDDMTKRLSGYKRAMQELGLPIKAEYIIDPKDTSVLGGRLAADAIMELNSRLHNEEHSIHDKTSSSQRQMTAAVACTDMIAYGMMERFKELGFSVPDNFALIGFDNTETAKTSSPLLSSVEQHLYESGSKAIELLLRLIRDGSTGQESYLIECSLALRESCGCGHAAHELDIAREAAATYEWIQDYVSDQKRIMQYNVHYEFNKFILNYKFECLNDLAWVLAPYFDWAMLGLAKGNAKASASASASGNGNGNGNGQNASAQTLTISQYSHFLDGEQQRDIMDIDIKSFPQLELLKKRGFEKECDVIYIIPYRTEVANWSALAVGSSQSKFLGQLQNHISIVHYLDLIASTLDRQALLEEIREQGRKYKTIAEHLEIVSRTSSDGIWEMDLRTGDVIWNERFYHLLDTDRAELFEELIHEEDMAGYHSMLNAHLHGRTPFTLDVRLRKGDGTFVWCVLSGEALYDAELIPMRLIGSVRNITERKEAEEQMRHMAYHDTLTGIKNRRGFNESLLKMIDNETQTFAVIILDLDHFKKINDSFGHQLGDRLLNLVALELKRLAKPEDAIARFGGDEYVIMYIYDSLDELHSFVRSVNLGLSQLLKGERYSFSISASAGISVFPRDGNDPDTLIKKADVAMYRVKQNGKNNYAMFSPDMIEHTMWRLNTENELKLAVEHNQLVLHYQPQFDLRTNEFYGVEALLRWNSPTQGLLFPMSFIELAEETGLIVPIGNWVLEEACRQSVKWTSMGYKPIKMSVNISGRQLKQEHFVQNIMDIIERTGMNPRFLCIEITESMIIDDLESTITKFKQLEQIGVQIAMDDFGTGYSSLSMLKKLPVHILKIDKTFIREITSEHQDIDIVKAIISISNSLQLEIVAEGVEQEEQQNLLRELGCHYVQGYFRSKPLPPGKLEYLMT